MTSVPCSDFWLQVNKLDTRIILIRKPWLKFVSTCNLVNFAYCLISLLLNPEDRCNIILCHVGELPIAKCCVHKDGTLELIIIAPVKILNLTVLSDFLNYS
jgi:hypothetical protein